MMQIVLTDSIVGIILALIASLFWNIAPILQKEALAKMEDIEAKDAWKHTLTFFKDSKWVLGLLLGLIGGVAYILGIQMAGIAVVQPLINVGLIVLAFLAHRQFGEHIDTRAKIGIGLMITTPLFIALGGVTEPEMFTAYDGILIYSTLMLIGTGVMLALVSRVAILWSPISAFLQALASQFTQWFTLVLFAGNGYIQGFKDGIIPLLLMGFFMLVSAVYTVSIGLQRNPAARFNSINGTVNMFAVVLGGILIFGQMVTNFAFYGIGLAFGVAGVILLSKFQE